MGHIIERISPRERVQHKEWRREFTLVGWKKGNGYSFPCKPNGELDTDDENYDCWKDNYKFCLNHPEKYTDDGVVENSWWYTEPEVVKCSCGTTLYLDGDTVCDCGQWYNGSGQALLDPQYWEEPYFEDVY